MPLEKYTDNYPALVEQIRMLLISNDLKRLPSEKFITDMLGVGYWAVRFCMLSRRSKSVSVQEYTENIDASWRLQPSNTEVFKRNHLISLYYESIIATGWRQIIALGRRIVLAKLFMSDIIIKKGT